MGYMRLWWKKMRASILIGMIITIIVLNAGNVYAEGILVAPNGIVTQNISQISSDKSSK